MAQIGKLGLDEGKINECRHLALQITKPVQQFITRHSTDSVERACLRLLGVAGVAKQNDELVPLPNILQELSRSSPLANDGPIGPLLQFMVQNQLTDATAAAKRIAQEGLLLPESFDLGTVSELGGKLANDSITRLKQTRQTRDDYYRRLKNPFSDQKRPAIYVIVATGNIFEDVEQAKSAAMAGADIIAVIRSTAQSLLDYVPYGHTTVGFGGTYATQENFRLMRQALDQVGEGLGRYICLTNYSSGLCMPEIAAMAGLERLDMLLNDSMYGILFRDINMKRTLIDQYCSRLMISVAGIIINTGEDNYLTTADAIESGHQVLASQFINERFAWMAGLPSDLQGLGHAFEMDPEHPGVFTKELSRAQMTRDIFPRSPIKYMPSTRYKSTDIFYSHLMDGMFNLVGVMTGQSIQLLGMPTEAIHTPLLQDRYIAIKSALYFFNGAKDWAQELHYKPGGNITNFAKDCLDQSLALLKTIESKGLFLALFERCFAEVSRHEDGGKGAKGVWAKSTTYYNPVLAALQKEAPEIHES